MADYDNENYDLHSEGFKDILNLTPQVTDNALLQCVQADLHYSEPGDYMNYDTLAPTDPQDSQNDHGPTPDKETASQRRVAIFGAFEDSAWIKKSDNLRMVSDPSSAIMQNLVNGKNRKHRTNILSSFDGPAYEYVVDKSSGLYTRAPVAVAFPAGNEIAVDDAIKHEAETVAGGGNQGLTIGKIAKVRTKIRKAMKGAPGQYYFVLDEDGIEDLLLKIPATSGDYVAAKAIAEGGIGRMMGFTFIVLDQCKEKTAGVRKYFALHDTAVHFGVRDVVTARVAPRADRKHRAQAYYECEDAAGRMIDAGVWRVLAAV